LVSATSILKVRDEAVWNQFNVAAKALIEKAKDESPAEQE
jgi:hypothetical protein